MRCTEFLSSERNHLARLLRPGRIQDTLILCDVRRLHLLDEWEVVLGGDRRVAVSHDLRHPVQAHAVAQIPNRAGVAEHVWVCWAFTYVCFDRGNSRLFEQLLQTNAPFM